MISAIACDIKELILATGYVNTHFEFCEIIKYNGATYPAQYTGGGNHLPVFDQDVNGNSYLRKNGKVTLSDPTGVDKIRWRACGGSTFVKMTYPLRLVMTVPKSNLNDSAFSDDDLALEIITALENALVVNIEGVKSLEYNMTDYDIDALSIWKQEVSGVDYQMNFNLAYIAINFNAVAVVNPSCLNLACYAY